MGVPVPSTTFAPAGLLLDVAGLHQQAGAALRGALVQPLDVVHLRLEFQLLVHVGLVHNQAVDAPVARR